MDAVLGWNLALSRPVILTIAWLAGRLLGVCHPGIEDRAALKVCRTTPSWWPFGHSVEAAEHERELAHDDHGLMGQWGLLVLADEASAAVHPGERLDDKAALGLDPAHDLGS